MIREFKASGTILVGKAMGAQLLSEIAHLGVKNPVIIAQKGHGGKARKVGRMLSEGTFQSLTLIDETGDPGESDLLILAGGKVLTDRFRDDQRYRVHFPLTKAHLEEMEESQSQFLVIDHTLIARKSVPSTFFEKYARSITGGMASPLPSVDIPGAFAFHGRTTVISGDRGLDRLPELLEEKKVCKPLLLTDKGIISVGLLDHVDAHLEGKPYVLFSDIPADSRIDVVNGISDLYRSEGCDGIIAFGGGSVLDTGKGVWLNVSLGVSDLNSMVGSGHIPVLTVPFIAVPTTSGTGSEVTKVAVVSDPYKGRKLLFNSDNLQPHYAVLDSRLTASLPPFLTSITGMDALTHAVEAFTCLGKNPLSDHLAWTAIELIMDHLAGAIEEPENLEHRRSLAMASNFAGSAFSNSMVGMVHTIGHSIGSVCHAPHGSCMSVLLPHVLSYNLPSIEPFLSQLLSAVAGKEVCDATPASERAEKTIEVIKGLNLKLKVLTEGRHPVALRDIKDRDGTSLVSETHFEEIAKTAMGDASIVYNPVEVREKDVLEILAKVF